jgi:hypothetical protein
VEEKAHTKNFEILEKLSSEGHGYSRYRTTHIPRGKKMLFVG